MIPALLALIGSALALPEEPRRLTPPIAVDSPYITTHLRLRQGAGLLRIPRYRLVDWDDRIDLVLAGAQESLEFQGAVSARTALFGRLGAQVISGLNIDSAFIHGAQTSGFFELGTRYRLWTDARGVVTARALVTGSAGAGLTPEPLASAFARDRWSTVSAVLDGKALDYVLGQRRGTAGALGLSGAWVASETVGLQASGTVRLGQVSYAGPDQRPQRTTRTAASVGVALDWRPRSLPIGLQFELHDRQEQEGWLAGDLRATQTNRALLAATLVYTGREELHLGLTPAVLAPALRPGSEQVVTLDATVRYDF